RLLGRPAAGLFRLLDLAVVISGTTRAAWATLTPDVRKARRPLPLQRYRFPPARAATHQHYAGAVDHGVGARHHIVSRRRIEPLHRLARPDRRHLRDLPDPDRGPRRPPDRPRLRRANHLARLRPFYDPLRGLCV